MKTCCIFNSKMYDTVDAAVSVIAEHNLVSGVVGVYNAETGVFMRKVTVNRCDDYTYTMYALFDGYESSKNGEYLYNMHLNTEQCYNTYEEVRCLLSTAKPGVYRIYCVEKLYIGIIMLAKQSLCMAIVTL